MSRFFKCFTYFLATLLCVLGCVLKVNAAGTCTYSGGVLDITFNISDDLVLSLKSNNKLSVGLNSNKTDKITIDDFVDEKGQIKCPSKFYYTSYKDPLTGQITSYWVNKTTSENTLTRTGSKNDNNNPNAKKLVRACEYGNYRINYFSDGTYSAVGGNLESDGTEVLSQYCPNELWYNKPYWEPTATLSFKKIGGAYSGKIGLTKGDPKPNESSGNSNQSSGNSNQNHGSENSTLECNDIFGDPKNEEHPAYWIQWCLNLMKYIAIVALLVLVIVDFLKALVQNDKDAMKKAGMNAAKRFIFCVLIFFLPIIVEFIMSLFGAYGTCGIG